MPHCKVPVLQGKKIEKERRESVKKMGDLSPEKDVPLQVNVNVFTVYVDVCV